MRTPQLVLLVLIGLLPPRGLPAGEQPSASTVDYAREIKPILSKRCYDCHGALKHKAGLRLDTAALMRKGGDSGPAVEPGQSDESLIVDAVTGRDGWRMPPESEGSPLSDQEIAKLKAWIDQGAKAPADEHPSPTRATTGRSGDPDAHRSLRPPPSATVRAGSRTRSMHSWPPNISSTVFNPDPPPTPPPSSAASPST